VWLSEAVQCTQTNEEKANRMYSVALILIIAWLLGIVSSYTLGGFIHVFLVVGLLLLLIPLLQGKRI
jgi:uncharacterized membrane protein